MPLPGNMPKVLAIIGEYASARVLIEELAKYEPIAVIDMDGPLHEALTDMLFNAGEGEDKDWNALSSQVLVDSLRKWAHMTFSESFLANRAVQQIHASEDSHSLYVIPNMRLRVQHEVFRTMFKSYEYLALYIRDEQWQPPFDVNWTYDPVPGAPHRLDLPSDATLIAQFLDLIDPPAEDVSPPSIPEEFKCVVCGVSNRTHIMCFCDRTAGGPWCADHFHAATNCTPETHGEGCSTQCFTSREKNT